MRAPAALVAVATGAVLTLAGCGTTDAVVAAQSTPSDWTSVPGAAAVIDRELGEAARGRLDVESAWWRIAHAVGLAADMSEAGSGLSSELLGCAYPLDRPTPPTDECLGRGPIPTRP